RNALHATPHGAPISLDAGSLAPERVRITVTDTGAGVSAEELARAAEPFFTTTSPGNGTRPGAFVARSTAEQLGRTLTLVPAPGAGTTATLALPADVVARPR